MTPIVLISKANMLAATNEWIHKNLDEAGGDNLTVPLIGISDPDDAEPTHYGGNWAAGDEHLETELRKGVVNSPHVTLFVGVNFDEAIASLGLRKKPQPLF